MSHVNRHPKPPHEVGNALVLWEVLKSMARRQGRHVLTPTRAELARLCGGVSVATISNYITALRKARWIRANNYPITDATGTCVSRVLKIALTRGFSRNDLHSRESKKPCHRLNGSHSRESKNFDVTLLQRERDAGRLTPAHTNGNGNSTARQMTPDEFRKITLDGLKGERGDE